MVHRFTRRSILLIMDTDGGDAGTDANGFNSPRTETHPATQAGNNEAESFTHSVCLVFTAFWLNQKSHFNPLLGLLSTKSVLFFVFLKRKDPKVLLVSIPSGSTQTAITNLRALRKNKKWNPKTQNLDQKERFLLKLNLDFIDHLLLWSLMHRLLVLLPANSRGSEYGCRRVLFWLRRAQSALHFMQPWFIVREWEVFFFCFLSPFPNEALGFTCLTSRQK